MLRAEELAHRMTEFAVGRVALREFEDWLVQSSWNAHEWASPDLRDAVYTLELVLAEYTNGHASSSHVRAVAGDVARELDASLHSIHPTQIGVAMIDADLMLARIAANPVLAAA
jgi:hypothetical protein